MSIYPVKLQEWFPKLNRFHLDADKMSKQKIIKEIDQKISSILVKEGIFSDDVPEWLKIVTRNLRRALVKEGLISIADGGNDE